MWKEFCLLSLFGLKAGGGVVAGDSKMKRAGTAPVNQKPWSLGSSSCGICLSWSVQERILWLYGFTWAVMTIRAETQLVSCSLHTVYFCG